MHPDGLEPPTYSSVDCRSIQLSYGCFLSRTRPYGTVRVWQAQKKERAPPQRAPREAVSILLYRCGYSYEVVIGKSPNRYACCKPFELSRKLFCRKAGIREFHRPKKRPKISAEALQDISLPGRRRSGLIALSVPPAIPSSNSNTYGHSNALGDPNAQRDSHGDGDSDGNACPDTQHPSRTSTYADPNSRCFRRGH